MTKFSKKYKEYLLSSEWAEIKIALYESRGKSCEKCGSNIKLQIHHLTYTRLFNEEPTDLIILCEECHKKEHKIVKKITHNKPKISLAQKVINKKNKKRNKFYRKNNIKPLREKFIISNPRRWNK